MKHKLAAILLTSVLLISGALYTPAQADETTDIPVTRVSDHTTYNARYNSFSSSGYNGDEKTAFAPTGDGVKSFILTSHNWTADGNAKSSRRQVRNGFSGVYIERYSDYDASQTDNPYEIPVEYGDPDNTQTDNGLTELTIDVSGEVSADEYNTLSYGVELVGAEEATVTTEIFTGSHAALAETKITEGWNLVSVDISGASGSFSHLRIGVDSGEAVRITSPFAETETNPGFAAVEKYYTDRLNDEIGIVITRSGRIKPEEGRAVVTADFKSFSDYPSAENAYFEFKLKELDGAGFTLGLNCKNADDTIYSKRISVSSSNSSGTYIIPISPTDEIESYILQFDNVKCGFDFTVEYVKFHRGAIGPADAASGVGTLAKITKDSTSVTFSGSMERSAVADYSSSKNGDGLIHFYALRHDSMDNLSCAFELGSIKLTTVFNYTADISSSPNIGDGHMYFAGVVDKNGRIIPLSRPRYPDYTASASSSTDDTQTSTVSGVSLYKPASVGAFESNASRVIIDVPLDKYIKKGGGAVVSYTSYSAEYDMGVTDASSGGSFEIDRELLSELDSEISFYITAGVRVYLRLTSDSYIKGLTGPTPIDETYQLTAGEDGMYSALVRFFAGRYPKIRGFELGCGVNLVPSDITDSPDGLTAYASEIAYTLRVTYNAAREYIADPYILVPFSEPGKTEENITTLLPEVITPLISEALREIGSIPWIYMYCFDECEDIGERTAALFDLLTELDCAGMSGIMYFFEPDSAYISEKFAENKTDGEQYSAYAARMLSELIEKVKGSRTRGVFFSLEYTDLQNDHEFYAALKELGETKYVYDSTANKSDSAPTDSAAAYTVFDFSGKHYPDGWIAGGGVESCLTDYSKIENIEGRVLRAEFKTDYRSDISHSEGGYRTSGAAGITLCRFKNTVNLSDVTSAVFEAALTLPEGMRVESLTSPVTSTVVFVIGSGDNRAEYYAEEVEAGGYHTFTCDLTGYEKSGEVNYIGIMVYSDAQVGLELKSVTLKSDTLTPDEIKSLVIPPDESGITKEEMAANYRFIAMVAFTITAGTIAAFILLARYEREEEERNHIEKNEKRTRQRQ